MLYGLAELTLDEKKQSPAEDEWNKNYSPLK